MKRMRLAILVVITPLLCLALLFEVVNPHSFLDYTGAILRGAALTVAAVYWIWLSRMKRDLTFKIGLGIVIVSAILYWRYGLEDLCYDNLDLLEAHERADGVSFFGDCTKVFSLMTSDDAQNPY